MNIGLGHYLSPWASPVPVVTVLWCLSSVCPNIQVRKAYAHRHQVLPPCLPQESLQLFSGLHHLNYLPLLCLPSPFFPLLFPHWM